MTRLFAVAAVLHLAACVTNDDDPVLPRPSPTDTGSQSVAAADLAPGQDPVDARCVAKLDRFALADGTCVARATVQFLCDPVPQPHTWARIGVLCDGEICAYDDVHYLCGAELARSFAIPCAATDVVGGATFDDPADSRDISCVSPSLTTSGG